MAKKTSKKAPSKKKKAQKKSSDKSVKKVAAKSTKVQNEKVKKKDQKSPKKVQKNPEKSVAKKAASKASFITVLKNQISSILLIVIGLLAVLFVAGFILQKAFQPVKIAKLLPFESTVMLLELDLFNARNHSAEALNMNVENGVNLAEYIRKYEEELQFDFEADVKPWMGVRHGYAVLENAGEDEAEPFESVFFVQSNDVDGTFEFISKFSLASHADTLSEEVYKNHSIYTYEVGQNFHFVVLDNYFVFAQTSLPLKQVIDVRLSERKSLQASEEYLKIRNNVTKGFAFSYYKPEYVFDLLPEGMFESSQSVIRPVLSLFTSMGHSMILSEEALTVQTYVNFLHQDEAAFTLPRLGKSYDAELLKKLPPHFEYVWGTRDLSKVIAEFGVVLNKLHPSSFNILEGILNAKKEQYFGYDLDLRDDIYKLFENEFIIALYAQPDHIDYLFLASDVEDDQVAKLQAFYLETMEGQGYSVLNEGIESESDMLQIFPFNERTNIYTADNEDIFVVSTDSSLVEQVIQGGFEGEGNYDISSYLKSYDEVSVMSPAFMGELFGDSVSPFLSNFTRIQAAKSIFLDGIAVVHVFEF